MQFAVATGRAADLSDLVTELSDPISSQFASRGADLGLLFVSIQLAGSIPDLLTRLKERLGIPVLLGTTGQGVIAGEEEIERGEAAVLLAAQLPDVEVRPFRLSMNDWQRILPEGGSLPKALGYPTEPRLFVTLGDPFTTPVDELLAAFHRHHPGVPIFGGLASGAVRPGGTTLLLSDGIYHEGVVGFSLSGALQVDAVVSQGCRPFGPVMEVTEAKENLIVSLGDRTPQEIIQELVTEIDEQERALLRNGLFIGRAIDRAKRPLGRGDFLVRGVIGIDRQKGSVAVGDRIDAGEQVQFHLRDRQTATEELEMLLSPQALYGSPAAALLFTCNGRGERLFGRPNGDTSTIQQILGGVPLAGTFCAGEIGPVGGRAFLHGHTASLAILRSGSAPEEDSIG